MLSNDLIHKEKEWEGYKKFHCRRYDNNSKLVISNKNPRTKTLKVKNTTEQRELKEVSTHQKPKNSMISLEDFNSEALSKVSYQIVTFNYICQYRTKIT